MPTIFFYFENQIKQQIIGPLAFNGMNYKQDDLEWKLHRLGALQSNLKRDMMSDYEKNDRINVCEEKMIKSIRQNIIRNNDSDEDY